MAVVGGRGFIGSSIARCASGQGYAVDIFPHDEPRSASYDAIVYASGIAWGAQARPVEAYDVHVASVACLLSAVSAKRIIYVSSTRVYDGAPSTHENTPLVLEAPDRADIYRSSKIAGEALILSASPAASVVRLSNVYGPSFESGLFLSDILRQAATSDVVRVRTSEASEKDYVDVGDAARAIVELCSLESVERIYNIARGRNTTHGEIFDVLRTHGVAIEIPEDAAAAAAMPIDVETLERDVSWNPRDVVEDLPDLLRRFQLHFRH